MAARLIAVVAPCWCLPVCMIYLVWASIASNSQSLASRACEPGFAVRLISSGVVTFGLLLALLSFRYLDLFPAYTSCFRRSCSSAEGLR